MLTLPLLLLAHFILTGKVKCIAPPEKKIILAYLRGESLKIETLASVSQQTRTGIFFSLKFNGLDKD